MQNAGLTRIKSDPRRFKRLGLELMWIGTGHVLSVLGGMLGVRLLTARLDPVQYGQLALGLTLGGLLTQLLFGPLQQGILRFFGPAKEANELPAYLSGIRNMLVRASILVFGIVGVVLAGLRFFGQVTWVSLAASAFLLALISGNERALDAMQTASRHRAISAWHQTILQWLRPFLAISLIAWLGAWSSIAMLGYVIATTITLASQYIFFWSKFRACLTISPYEPKEAQEWMRRIQSYAWPFASWGLFSWMQQSSDRWALQCISNTRDVGYYAVLQQLGYGPVVLIASVAVQFLQPILFNRAGAGTDQSRLRYARSSSLVIISAFLILTAVATSLAFLFHAFIFGILAAPEYRAVSALMPWMVLAGGLYATSEATALLLMSDVSTKRLIAPKITSSVVGVLLNAAGAWWLGLRGVVAAGIVFSMLSLIWMLVLSSRPPNRAS